MSEPPLGYYADTEWTTYGTGQQERQAMSETEYRREARELMDRAITKCAGPHSLAEAAVPMIAQALAAAYQQGVEQSAKVAKDYQNETAKAWTKLTESQEQEIEQLRAEATAAYQQGREDAAKAAHDWLQEFGRDDPKLISAKRWAGDAVRDIIDAIRRAP